MRAPRADARRALIVSLHDVAPDTLDRVRILRDELDEIGARPRVLKVVPERLAKSPELRAFLCDEVARGSEIVLHGYAHRAAGPLRGTVFDNARARLFARDAVEFLTLDEDAMRERIVRGRDALRELGIEPRGFCPPAWLAAPELPHVLCALGFTYAVSMWTLHDLRTDRRIWTPWLGVVGADPLQERLVSLGGALTLLAGPALGPLKVFLHPTPPDHAATRWVLGVLRRIRPELRIVTYSQLVSES